MESEGQKICVRPWAFPSEASNGPRDLWGFGLHVARTTQGVWITRVGLRSWLASKQERQTGFLCCVRVCVCACERVGLAIIYSQAITSSCAD